MWSDLNTWRRAYHLVHFLYPNPDVVEDIIREALRWLPQVHVRQHKRSEVQVRDKPVRPRFENPEVFFQLSLFETSERWEKHEELRAAPKPSMLLVRYIKHCVWQGLGFADSRYTAFGLGCLLYAYTQRQVCDLFCLDAENHGNRVIRKMQERLEVRFEHIISQCRQALKRVSPTAGECQLIEQALTLFTPWGTACPVPPVTLPPVIDELPAALHHHVLIHPACGGIAQSVQGWNREQCTKAQLPDPRITLEVPMFTEDRDNNDFDGSSPPELSDQELENLKTRIIGFLPSTLQRRREPGFLTFRVCVDGQEWGQFTPEAHMLSLTVPASAWRLQIFGQDAEGELPLALFYLPDFLEEVTPQRLYAVLEGGATFEVVVTPVVEPDGTITAGRVDLQFWAEEAQVLKTSEWYEAAVTAAGLSVEVARLAGDQRLEAALLARLGDLYQAQDQPADALAYWQASVALAQHMGDKELEAVLGAKLAEANTRQGILGHLMETIKIRVEGFDFEEFASLFVQLVKDAGVSIQVNRSSERHAAFAYDPATIIVQGPEVLAAALHELATLSIYLDGKSKTETRDAAPNKSTPARTCTIVLHGTGGWRQRWKVQEGVSHKEEIECLAAIARENGVDRITVHAPPDQLWP